MKRVAYLLGIVAAVALVVAVGYFFRYRNEPATQEQPPTMPGGLPAIPTAEKPAEATPSGGAVALSQKFGVVTSNPVRDYFVDPQDNLFLVQPDGQVVKITNNKAGSLSSAPIQNLISASFSYDGQKVLAVFGDRSAPQASVFDVPGKTWRPLPTDIENPVWAPADYRIAYLSPTGRALTTLNLGDTKAKPQTALKLRAEDTVPMWPTPDKIFLTDTPSAFSQSSIWRFNLGARTLTSIIENQFGMTMLPNGKADRILLFTSNRSNRGGNLKVIDGNGTTLKIVLFLTLPSKCTFYEESIAPTQATSTKATTTPKIPAPKPQLVESLLCAVPRDYQALVSNPLPDNYDKRALFTEDNIYKVGLATGAVTTVFDDPAFSIDAENLKVFGKKLFFVNRYDKKLYAVSLD